MCVLGGGGGGGACLMPSYDRSSESDDVFNAFKRVTIIFSQSSFWEHSASVCQQLQCASVAGHSDLWCVCGCGCESCVGDQLFVLITETI